MSDDKNGIPLAGTQDDAFMPANTGKGKAGFGSAFCHAVKKSHNFFSIFLRYDLKLSRPRRFLIYFLRVLGLMTVTSLFYQQIKVRSSVLWCRLIFWRTLCRYNNINFD